MLDSPQSSGGSKRETSTSENPITVLGLRTARRWAGDVRMGDMCGTI